MKVKWKTFPELGVGEVLRKNLDSWEVRFSNYSFYQSDSDFHDVRVFELDIVSENPSPMEIVNKYHEEALTKDAVDHPDHYNNGAIECIEYLKDNMSWQGFTGYLEGNCKKYLHRWRYKKKPIEDLKKARWYLDRLIKELETEGNDN